MSNRSSATNRAVNLIEEMLVGKIRPGETVSRAVVCHIMDDLWDAARRAGYSEGYDEGMEYGTANANPSTWD